MNNTIKNNTYSKDNITISYDVQFSIRRSMSIHIKGIDGEVIVKLPMGESVKTAQKLVEEKFEWIIKSKEKVSKIKETINQKIYTEGSTHLFLGIPYTLNIVVAKGGSVRQEGNKIIVTTSNSERVEKLMKAWYADEAKKFLIPLTSKIAVDFNARHKKMPSSLELKYVKSYWGMCTSRRVIKLNIELMRAPVECIKYIITHELCHLIHQNHSKRFYDLLQTEFPDWKESRKLLEQTISCRS
ncbi:MAG: SprT family zinc-dependent metalloprotease [Rikenellaceae bacterium]